ncbi:MAG: cytochrome c biogenesis CcdA family protein [Actinomycetota bacterium]
MIDAPLAFAFTAGLVAAINPCGFAMLPAYLSFFLGREDADDRDTAKAVTRAITTSLSLALGFLAVFAVVGSLLNAGVDGLRDVLPWVVIVIGVAMVALGVSFVLGRKMVVNLPRLQRGGTDRSVGSMALFGASYATASLGCTLPLFLVAVVTRPDGFASGLVSVIAYALGMTLTITALTVSMALARSTVLTNLRRVMPHVERISGVLLVLTGLYTIWFWVNDLTAENGRQPGPIVWVEERSFELQRWVDRTGGLRVGLLLAMIVAGAVLAALVAADRSQGRQRATAGAERPSVDEPAKSPSA